MQRQVKALRHDIKRRIADFYFRRRQRDAARTALNTLEAALGKTDPANVRRAEAYARDVFGSADYAPWLTVYCAVSGTFREGWIPENYYGKFVVPHMQGRYGSISSLRACGDMIFGDDLFPDIGYFVNGLFYGADRRVIDPGDLKQHLFRDAGRIVFKTDDSYRGMGVYFLDRDGFSPAHVRLLGNGVFQGFIDQHAVFEHIVPGPVATLRIATVIDDCGGCSVRACNLRLGRRHETHVKLHGQILIKLDRASGALAEYGYLDWDPVTHHPDTGVAFAGHVVPGLADAFAKVVAAHRRFPYARCVGWDVAIDRAERTRVMEWNGWFNGIAFAEAISGPCFSDLGWEKLRR